jgi:hypothetical protein
MPPSPDAGSSSLESAYLAWGMLGEDLRHDVARRHEVHVVAA